MEPEHSKRPNQDLLKYHMTHSRWAWLGGRRGELALMGDREFTLSVSPAEDIETFSGNLVANSYESHVLPDGSIVEMNLPALKVDYTLGCVAWSSYPARLISM